MYEPLGCTSRAEEEQERRRLQQNSGRIFLSGNNILWRADCVTWRCPLVVCELMRTERASALTAGSYIGHAAEGIREQAWFFLGSDLCSGFISGTTDLTFWSLKQFYFLIFFSFFDVVVLFFDWIKLFVHQEDVTAKPQLVASVLNPMTADNFLPDLWTFTLKRTILDVILIRHYDVVWFSDRVPSINEGFAPSVEQKSFF